MSLLTVKLQNTKDKEKMAKSVQRRRDCFQR